MVYDRLSLRPSQSKISLWLEALHDTGPSGFWGEGLFIFREFRRTGNYFRGAGQQGYSFGDIGSRAKKRNLNKSHLKGKASILLDF